MSRSLRILALVAPLMLASAACDRPGVVPPVATTSVAPAAAAVQAPAAERRARRRDLSIDESMGGHTLARHVGKSDVELGDRLRREPDISSASTYLDRATAERVVGTGLAAQASKLEAWQSRHGQRPNLALYYTDRSGSPIGRSLSREQRTSTACSRAIIVLRWDERRDRFYVLTSYPEAGR